MFRMPLVMVVTMVQCILKRLSIRSGPKERGADERPAVLGDPQLRQEGAAPPGYQHSGPGVVAPAREDTGQACVRPAGR